MTAPTDPNFDLYASERGRILGTSIALFIITPTVVALRFLSRKLSKAGLWWDDYLCVVALIAALAMPALCIWQLRNGYGRHIFSYPPAEMEAKAIAFSKCLWIFELAFHIATGTAKFAILLFYQRILPVPRFRRLLPWVGAFCVAYMVAMILAVIFQCQPVHFAWDQVRSEAKGRCIVNSAFFVGGGSVNAVLNTLIFALPIPLLLRLRTTLRQQIILTIMFTLAGFVVLVSIIWVIVLSKLKGKDLTWDYVDSGIWTALEPNMAVVCACISSLRPLFSVVGRSFTHGPLSLSRSRIDSTTGGSKRTWGSAVRQSQSHFSQLDEEDLRLFGHGVAVRGGRGNAAGEGDEEAVELPQKGISVRTDITLVTSERVDYNDRLF